MIPRLLAPALLCLVVGACNSTGVGNPGPAQASLAITADGEPEPEALDPEETLPAAGVEHAVVVLGSLRWLPCDDGAAPVTQDGPFVVDLAQGKVTPALEPVEVPEGGFCELQAPLQPAPRPAELAGRSLLLSGTRADGVPFLVFASAEGTLKLHARNDVPWDESLSHPVLWAMRPRRWLGRSELSGVPPIVLADGRSMVVIDADRHPLLFTTLLSRIAGRSSLHLDANDNGTLDDTERLGEDWIGVGLSDIE